MVDDFPSLRATDSSDNSDVDSGNVSAIDTMKSDLGPQSPQQTAVTPSHTHMVDSNEDDPKSLYQSEDIVNMELDNIETEDGGDAAAAVKKPKRIPKRRQTVDTTLELLNRTESMNNIMSRLDDIQKPIHDILKRLDTINKKLNSATKTTTTATVNTQTPVSNKSSSASTQPAKSKSIASKRKSIDTPLPSSSPAPKKKRSNSEVKQKKSAKEDDGSGGDDDDEQTGSDTDGDEVKKSMERNIRLYSIGSSDFYLMCRKKQNVIDGQKNLEKKFGQCNLLKTWNNRTNVKDIGKLILQKFPHLKWNARTNIITNCRNKQVSQSDLLSYLVKTIK
ncbi:hypothetical protein MdSGHV071 [Musca domestica salivary gland hypertrophy virus]|uniref:Uncharacterized protein n=1 Tax=Musca hytrovirus(isolate Musca domestica/United States/Boucias/-) TaxID=523909 RepID=B2YG48_MHVB|nr:hypothetical protein MdSGHV071 [Musca domestica salivary gland hypertrophy virus]ACD03530.1 hypothetical protein MdSGHV071 [Musca domestica salivary gland hypertrophy virus]